LYDRNLQLHAGQKASIPEASAARCNTQMLLDQEAYTVQTHASSGKSEVCSTYGKATAQVQTLSR
jgi:hypothetical protein